MANTTVNDAMELAIQFHNDGQLVEAEKIYQHVLQVDPDHPDALHLLGVIAFQVGQAEPAIELIEKSLSIRPHHPEAFNNLANAQQMQNHLEEAIANYTSALTLKPDYYEACHNLGNALAKQHRYEDALIQFQKAVQLNPAYGDAYNKMGLIYHKLAYKDQALQTFQKALSLQPNDPRTHNNLAHLFKDLDHLSEAESHYQKALALNPNFAETYLFLGVLQRDMGKIEEAIINIKHALALNPDEKIYQDSLAETLSGLAIKKPIKGLSQDLLRLLNRKNFQPAPFIRPTLSTLYLDPDFTALLCADNALSGMQIAEKLSIYPHFLKLMSLCPINDMRIERMLTRLRKTLLKETVAGKTHENINAFLSALALHCFVNEYAFYESLEETQAVETLSDFLARQEDISLSKLYLLACYRPLYLFNWAEKFKGQDHEVIQRQITEPLAEQQLRSTLPQITELQDGVSRKVRDQYEENPYPRWITTSLETHAKPIDIRLQQAPYHLNLEDYVAPDKPDILVAGCGSGQQPIHVATNFANAKVLAVDLSLSSLSYAKRKCDELGIDNIDFAQADLLELTSLDKKFDLIACTGVLHHLEDPIAGWRNLVDLLNPNGLMHIALYSELARTDIVKGRDLIKDKGYRPSQQDMRSGRQEIFRRAEAGDPDMQKITKMMDFYSLSECRDLLFHVQEHRFTLLQIKDILATLNLDFLGFDFEDQTIHKKYQAAYQDDTTMTSLSNWHAFETQNPDLFLGMYQFWCQKTQTA